MEPVDCRKCKHYHITWDRQFPYGCKAMKFKSSSLPALEVLASSGLPCQFFESKEKGEAVAGPRNK